MLTENEQKYRDQANEIAIKFLDIITDAAKSPENIGAPREQILFGCHVVANLFARMCMVLEGYGQLNNIEKLDIPHTITLINKITKEYIKANKKGKR